MNIIPKSIFALLLFTITTASAQQPKRDSLVQFSGVVVTSDSLKPVPFASIIIHNSFRGTISDYFGFFSLVAKMKDTIEFTAIGYKKATFIVPDTINDSRCSLIQIMIADTIMLKEALIYPWPTREQFKEAFVNLHVPDDDMTRAKRNLNKERMSMISENMGMDGSMNFKNSMYEHSSRLYYAGQVPSSNWLSPIAWAKFIRAWQNGEFKKKDKKKLIDLKDDE